jgi:hypothetical protein
LQYHIHIFKKEIKCSCIHFKSYITFSNTNVVYVGCDWKMWISPIPSLGKLPATHNPNPNYPNPNPISRDFGISPIIKNWFRTFTIPQSGFARLPL